MVIPKWDMHVSYYNIVHVEDSGVVREMHQNGKWSARKDYLSVLRSGSVISCYYRIINTRNEFFYVEVSPEKLFISLVLCILLHDEEPR